MTVNGSFDYRIPGAINLSFEGVSAERLQQSIRSVAEISAGSACSTGKTGPSHVMLALGLSGQRAEEPIRITLGRFTTEDEVHLAMDAIVPTVERLRLERSRQRVVFP